MPVIDLNRRFVEWNKEESSDSEIRRRFGLGEDGVGWEELLVKRRVIVLAEAGSGKSTELKERWRNAVERGQYAFHASVEDVGREGLERALPFDSRAKLAGWRKSNDEAWFFIDSVDEAKSTGIRLEKVFRNLAEGIESAEERSHIVLSGRVTDWEFRRDLESVTRWLPLSSASPPQVTGEEELIKILRQVGRRNGKAPAPELPFVALMASLDRDRIQKFAEGKAVPNVGSFLAAIEAGNLWHFSRRPLDLDWIVRFWQTEGRLGSLEEMVGQSIAERLKETNTYRVPGDTLDNARAVRAVERIAAAMVFGRQSTLRIPDSEVGFASDSPLDLAEVLPDWSAAERSALLSRPIFDPATLGRARFHNDNNGVVRGFLTARWLLELRQANLSTTSLFDLLFADSYGIPVIKPSLHETAAWLSLWDKEVANDVVRRNPVLLLSAGDPASLSSEVRKSALISLVQELANSDSELPWLDDDKLRRFACPDLGNVVASLWPKYKSNNEAAYLLLRIVWLGVLKDCADLVREAAFDATLHSLPRVVAGRALLAVGNEATRKDYAHFVLTRRRSLPGKMVRDAVLELFPKLISVDQLLELFETAEGSPDEGALYREWDGPLLVDKLGNPQELERLLTLLLAQLGGGLGEHAYYPPTDRETAYFAALARASLRLLEISPPNSTPNAAVDAILRISNRKDHRENVQKDLDLAWKELSKTSPRRRAAFWLVANRIRSCAPGCENLAELRPMEMLGFRLSLSIDDTAQLLEEGLAMTEDDRRLALDASTTTYRRAGEPAGVLHTIASIVASDPISFQALQELMKPRQVSAEHIEFARESWQIGSQGSSEQAERDREWIDFIRDLNSDPERGRRMLITPPSGVNSDLLNLWRLLWLATSQTRYSIDSIAPLERIAGRIAEAARAGFILHWRNSPPLLRSEKEPKKRNSTRWEDLMGLAGISLEAVSAANWADQLSPVEATRAAGYATLELNGFPSWLPQLAASKPTEVSAVLVGQIVWELTQTGLTHYDILQKVAYSDEAIAVLLAPTVLEELEARPQLPQSALSYLLHVITKGIRGEQAVRFIQLGIERFQSEADPASAVEYLAAVFTVRPQIATAALTEKLDLLSADDRASLVDRFLSAAFGDSRSGLGFRPAEIPAEILSELVRLNFRTLDKVVGRQRPPGEAYWITDNDRADQARSTVFNRLAATPGAATYQALLAFQSDPTCPVPARRLRALAEQRAAQDSEGAPWLPADAFAFEQHHETEPRTPKDLQAVLLSRIEDMQHELLHGDFSQGSTLKAIEDERGVQNWIADRLRLKQGLSFSVEREPHVVEEKEPDVRVRAKSTDANVSVEIKVAESWTLKQLDDALEIQLCGRYLRATSGRYGVLLLVHQDAPSKGWKDTNTQKYLSFLEVVERLKMRAATISGAGHDSPQPAVAVLDVSSC